MLLSGLRFACILALCAFAAACNPVPPELRLATGTPFSPEWCQAAKELPNHGGSLSNLAKCHERGVPGFPKDDAVIAAYYTQAARWGDPDAMASLARLGQPIPDDDLRREAAARAERERTARMLANALTPRPQPQPRVQPAVFGSPPPISRPTRRVASAPSAARPRPALTARSMSAASAPTMSAARSAPSARTAPAGRRRSGTESSHPASAAQNGVMTQSQARRACINDIRGESRRAAPRATLDICMRQKMFGR